MDDHVTWIVRINTNFSQRCKAPSRRFEIEMRADTITRNDLAMNTGCRLFLPCYFSSKASESDHSLLTNRLLPTGIQIEIVTSLEKNRFGER